MEETAQTQVTADNQESEKKLLTWKAPARPFKKRNREFYTTIGAIVFLLAVILLFLKEWLLIGVLLSLVFVSYALASVPPEEVEHSISSKGIRTGGKFYGWENLARFWFVTKWGQETLVVEVKSGFPGRLLLLLGELSRNEVRKVVEEQVKFDEPEPSVVDRAAGWMAKKFPLENE